MEAIGLNRCASALLDQFNLRLNAAGQVVNETGTMFSVIHQYDRIPELKKYVLSRL